MLVNVIIPVKSLDRAKSRLSAILSSEERRLLCEKTLLHVLEVSRCPQVSERIVVTRDPYVRRLAKEQGALTILEKGDGLNQALVQATHYLMDKAIPSILVLPSDLPYVETQDIETIIRLGKPEKSIVISPCRRGNGTNALFIKPPGIMEYCFGDKSFFRHQELAFQCSVVPVIYRSHGIGFDLDFPEDFQGFLRGEGLYETNQYFSYSGLSHN